MTIENKVAWLEGMFLEPQHFQQQDRYIEHQMILRESMRYANNWGFSALELDTSLLSVGKLTILCAKGIFPDGTPFSIPRNDLIPQPFEIPVGLDGAVLYLAIPSRQANAAEVGIDNKEQLYRYQVKEMEVKDNTMNSDSLAQLRVGELACQILSEHDDLNGYTCLPIAKIQEARSNQQVQLDQTFVTTYIDIHDIAHFKRLIEEIHGLLNNRAVMLSGRLTDAQQAGTAEIVDFMLLQLINRYEPLFFYLINKKSLHPEDLYKVLIQLAGEMATFTFDSRRPREIPVYNHAQLFDSFKPVVKALRHSLSVVLEQNATAIPLTEQSSGHWVGVINDKAILHNSTFILAVYADMPLESLRSSFPAQVKIAPVEMIQTLVSRALPGIEVSPIAVAPRQIPYHSNFCYFALSANSEYWENMPSSAGIALHIGHEYPGMKLELWAIKG